MNAPVRVSNDFASGARTTRCIEVTSRDGASMRGFMSGAPSAVVIVAGTADFISIDAAPA